MNKYKSYEGYAEFIDDAEHLRLFKEMDRVLMQAGWSLMDLRRAETASEILRDNPPVLTYQSDLEDGSQGVWFALRDDDAEALLMVQENIAVGELVLSWPETAGVSDG